MAHVTGPCRPEELPELLQLVDRIFRSRQPGDMGAEYPLLFGAENCEQLRVIRAGGRIVAHVGICIRDAVVLGCSLRVASIGSVGTDPEYRGQGMASDLMADAAAHSRARGASLMLISGGRGLYHRLGYVAVGQFVRYRAPAASSTPDLELAPMGEGELDAVIALHQREPVRFVRPREDWERLLAAGMLMNHPADLLLARQAGRPVAYLAVRRCPPRREGERLIPEALEYAGSRRAAAAALPAVAARYQAEEAQLVALADDAEMETEATARGYTGAPEAFHGTLAVLDARRFLEAIRPYLAERLGSDLSGLSIEAAAEGTSFRLGEETLDLPTRRQLTAVLFGGDTEEARHVPAPPPRLGALLARVFPMPLLWYGYNYV